MATNPDMPNGSVPLSWFRSIPAPLFLLDRRGKISYCNDAFAEMSGYRRDEIVGASLDAMVGQEAMRDTLRDVLQLYEGKGLVHVQHDLIRKSGTRVHVVLDLTPVYGEGEEGAHVIGAVGLVRDYQELG